MYQARLSIGTNMRLHAEEVLVAFLRLVHFRVAFAFLILGRTGGVDDRGIESLKIMDLE